MGAQALHEHRKEAKELVARLGSALAFVLVLAIVNTSVFIPRGVVFVFVCATADAHFQARSGSGRHVTFGAVPFEWTSHWQSMIVRVRGERNRTDKTHD